MEWQQYNNILNYLQQNTLPNEIKENNQKDKFINLCNKFIIKHSYLYKKDKKKPENLLWVIWTFELELTLYMMHNDLTASHFAAENMFNKIKGCYYWPQMFEDIREYVKSCDSC